MIDLKDLQRGTPPIFQFLSEQEFELDPNRSMAKYKLAGKSGSSPYPRFPQQGFQLCQKALCIPELVWLEEAAHLLLLRSASCELSRVLYSAAELGADRELLESKLNWAGLMGRITPQERERGLELLWEFYARVLSQASSQLEACFTETDISDI